MTEERPPNDISQRYVRNVSPEEVSTLKCFGVFSVVFIVCSIGSFFVGKNYLFKDYEESAKTEYSGFLSIMTVLVFFIIYSAYAFLKKESPKDSDEKNE
ncbi:hypothetical protein BLNAU_13072 [Blattamonas nauphoetae]|uniref:Uncharacterized protein n=1 Tax=Blattamonas nauphoetae TaxID=2049346 RepID=A0ABQ9XMY4_9EUKA|nr:hypothetical protein BLNAU_13072 [Blattamonas nauphoetae]